MQLARNKEEMAIECTEIIDSEAGVCSSAAFRLGVKKMKSYIFSEVYWRTDRTFEHICLTPPRRKVSDFSTLQDDVGTVPAGAAATQHEPGLVTESVKQLDKSLPCFNLGRLHKRLR